MKPAWDKLMDEFAGHKTILVADVDCDGSGKDLCDTYKVEGFPTVRYGSMDSLEDYSGARDFPSMQEFAQKLKPPCTPTDQENCSEEDKAQISKFMAMSKEELEKLYKVDDAAVATVNAEFHAGVQAIEDKYEKMEKTKIEKVKAINTPTLKTILTVFVHKGGELKKPAEDMEGTEEGGEEMEGGEGMEGDEDIEGDDGMEGMGSMEGMESMEGMDLEEPYSGEEHDTSEPGDEIN